VIIVASVSSIYGLGSPDDYRDMMVAVRKGQTLDRDDMLRRLVDIQYDRNDVGFERGRFRVRGDCVEIWPSYEEYAYRIELWGDEVDQLSLIDPVSGETLSKEDQLFVYPAKHFVLPESRIENAVAIIKEELEEQLEKFRGQGKLLEAQRLNARTRFDIEMLSEVGYCPGVENYSRPLSGREPGERPHTLYDFFPDDFLLFVDESHVTTPQIRAMYAGDRSRKINLVEHGFRLPCALDNRPLKFEEWQEIVKQAIYVSATPSDFELEESGGEVVEQIIRPTGLLDPVVEVQPARTQVSHLLGQVKERAELKERVLVTALTKRLAEDLAHYLSQNGVACKWLHSELDAFERVELLRDLREGQFDCLVGVNLLREGLDLPEVSMVAILDADKEGFLRSETSLIQTIGRAARNVNAKVILYADKMTDSMAKAIEETRRRREIQQTFNEQHGITPETIRKNVRVGIESASEARKKANEAVGRTDETEIVNQELLNQLEGEMLEAAEDLEFEKAAAIRDRITHLRDSLGESIVSANAKTAPNKRRRKGRSQIPRPKKRN
jgi:excinuclease ABC subunit B